MENLCISNILSIYIITYNRSSELMRTLSALANSSLRQCQITVLDNYSTDETFNNYQINFSGISNFSFRKNVVNIGLGANAIQPFLLSKALYTWILCDDDLYCFDEMDDVFQALREAKATLLLVGGHREEVRRGAGMLMAPAALMSKKVGVNYYRDTSFLPSTIYLTSFARNYISQCYAFCCFCYPHMALAIAARDADERVYVSKHNLISPTYGTQSYHPARQLEWWFNMSFCIVDPMERKRFLTSQWIGPLDPSGLYGLLNTSVRLNRLSIFTRLIIIFKFAVVQSIFTMLKNRIIRSVFSKK